jgi:hypothetical protein
VGVYARIAEAYCDGKISFLLRCCQRGGVVGPIHVARSGKISARVKVGVNSEGVELFKPQMFESEADVRSIMNQAAKDDEIKKDEGRAAASKRYTIQKLKSMAEHKMVYCHNALDNVSERAKAVATTGVARLSGTQKLHQEMTLQRELRTVRPARPRPPITAAGGAPLRNQSRKRTRDEATTDFGDGAKRQQVSESRGRGRGGGRGGGRARGRGNRGGAGLNSNISSDVNGFGGFGSNRGNRGNGRGSRGHSQPNLLPPSMQQALFDSLPPAFMQKYNEWNSGGSSEENPVNLEENNHY